MDSYRQLYNFSFLPKDGNLPSKISLNVSSDLVNSLRFSREIELREFIEDAVISYLMFLELTKKPYLKAEFRMAQLDELIVKLKAKCINEWKNPKKIEYNTTLPIG